MLAAGSALAVMAACGSQPTENASGEAQPAGKKVVAATTWEAAYAKAAGAENVQIIVPSSVHHAADYDPKPSDLAAVADADIVLYAPFEGFVGKLRDAGGSKAQLVEMQLDNSPENVRAQVSNLAGMLGTHDKAELWLHDFDKTVQDVSGRMRAAWPNGKPPRVVAQAYVTYIAQLAGADVVGTYGPQPVTPAQLADLSAKQPDLVLDNAHMSTGPVLPGSPAKQVSLINYPEENLDLLDVYRTDAQRIVEALRP
ncbi:zinc ABC transporter substrate-binding protein [Saccharopolyspora shandongensis]|uniref:metal ABC transporter solute-binding protein, Zn/Mn family n=1 Tax=Saccharopolyspora shandongensis TaxID=418495 RepID=UPI0034450F4F